MGIFIKRPLLAACAAYLAAALLCVSLCEKQRLLCLLIFLGLSVPCLLCALLYKKRRAGFAKALLCLLFGATAVLSSHLFFDRMPNASSASEPIDLTAKITDVGYVSDYLTVCTAQVREYDGKPANFSIELTFAKGVDLQTGDVIGAAALPTEFEENIYGYNERQYMLSRGVLFTAETESYEVLGHEKPALHTRLQNRITERVDTAFNSDTAALLKALLVGERDGLSTSLKRDFRRLGISHILSISGTHFTVLLGLAAFLLKALRLNKKTIYILLIPLALSYMALTGFSVTVCRAGVMALMTYFAFLFGRTRDAYTALFLAVASLLTFRPYAVADIGLWLSFAATFSILILGELFSATRLSGSRGILGFLCGVLFRLALTVVVFFATLPIVALSFGEASKLAPLANLLIVPLFELFLYLAPFSVLLSGFAPAVRLTESVCDFICCAASALADRDDLLFSLRQPLVLPIAVCGILLTLILLAVRLKHPILSLLPLCLTLAALAVYIPLFDSAFAKADRIVYTTVGTNDGFLVKSGGEALYIDISTGASEPTRKAEYLAEMLYRPEFDGYLPTHYHTRHINTFDKLTDRTHIKRLYLPPPVREGDEDIRSALAEIAVQKGIEVIDVEYEKSTAFGGCAFTLCTPEKLSRSTHYVTCLSISSGKNDCVYLGSSFGDTTRDFSALVDKAKVVVLGQHSPVTKNDFTLETDGVVLFGSETVAAHANCESASAILPKNGSYTFVFDRN